MAEAVGSRAHLNLIESSRRLYELDRGAEVEAGAGWLFGAGTADHPAISNAAFRIDDGLEGAAFVERAREFFAGRGRGFVVWARVGAEEDADLLAAAGAAGLQNVYEMPEMVLRERAEERPLADGVEISRLGSAAEAEDYWAIARAAYESVGFPPEVFGHYEGLEEMAAGTDAAAFLARLGGEPVGIAMTIVNHGVAGVYWVGSLERARGRGIGRAITVAATNAGLDLGADLASLQASHMGEPVYRGMGYERIFDYRLLLCPAR